MLENLVGEGGGLFRSVGSATPGSYGAVTEIYGEGLRLPPLRLVSQGRLNEDLEKVILAKVGKAVFHDLVLPGDQISLEAQVDNIAEEAATISGTIRCGDKVIAEINLMFIVY